MELQSSGGYVACCDVYEKKKPVVFLFSMLQGLGHHKQWEQDFLLYRQGSLLQKSPTLFLIIFFLGRQRYSVYQQGRKEFQITKSNHI